MGEEGKKIGSKGGGEFGKGGRGKWIGVKRGRRGKERCKWERTGGGRGLRREEVEVVFGL